MKYSLRTLLIVTTLFIIGLTAHFWWEAEKKRRTIPVQVNGEIDYIGPMPSYVAYTPGRLAIWDLKSVVEATKPAPTIRERAIELRKQGTTIKAVVKNPIPFAHWRRKNYEDALSNGETVKMLIERLVPLLDDESINSQNRFQFARILASVGDKRGFDWGIARMGVDDAWDKPQTPQEKVLLFTHVHRPSEWLINIDAWELLKTRLYPVTTFTDRARGIAQNLYPGRMEQWYIQQMRRPEATIDEIQKCLFKISYFAPSLEAINACSPLFVKPGPNYTWSHVRRHAAELTRIGRGGEIDSCSLPGTYIREWYQENKPSDEELAEIRIKVCKLANILANDGHWISREYEEVICEFGDESWRDYFEQRVKVSDTQRTAFIALARLEGENREQFLRKHAAGFAGQTEQLQTLAQTIICTELAGTRDSELTNLLTKLFRQSDKKSDAHIRLLFLLGSNEIGMELLTEYRAIHPKPPGPDVQQLLVELQSRGFAKGLTVDDIDEQIMSNDPLRQRPFLQPEEQVRVALEEAGLRTEVYHFAEMRDQFARLSNISRGQFDVDLVYVNAAMEMIFFRYDDRVFRYDAKYAEDFQSPFIVAAVANAILRRLKSPNRFVPYGDYDGNAEINFLYGPHDLAKLLESQFGVKFQSDWEEYFQPLNGRCKGN